MRFLAILFSLLFSHIALCQDESIWVDSLNTLRSEVVSSKNDRQKAMLNTRFTNYLENFLIKNLHKADLLDSIPYLANLSSNDNLLRILNWTVSFEDGSYQYFGFICLNKSQTIIKLNDQSDSYLNPQFKKMNNENWYGALYFDIQKIKSKKSPYYLLLGWDGNSNYTTKKIIETLIINDESVQFGLPVFNYEDQTSNRVIFEYSKEVVMSLRYHKKQTQIVFDHLAPIYDGAEGMYEFYGPDLSFDALVLRKNIWVHEKAIDVRGNTGMDNYIDPRKQKKKKF